MHRCDANSPLTYRAPDSKNSIIIQLSPCFPSQPLQQPLSHKNRISLKAILKNLPRLSLLSIQLFIVVLCAAGVRLYHTPYEM